jgi:hypothetical protein
MDALWVIEAGHCPCHRRIGTAGIDRPAAPSSSLGRRDGAALPRVIVFDAPDSTNVRESGMLVAVHRAGFLDDTGSSTNACRSIPARADTDDLLKLHSWRSGGQPMTKPSTIDIARARPAGEPAG